MKKFLKISYLFYIGTDILSNCLKYFVQVYLYFIQKYLKCVFDYLSRFLKYIFEYTFTQVLYMTGFRCHVLNKVCL